MIIDIFRIECREVGIGSFYGNYLKNNYLQISLIKFIWFIK